MDLKKEIKILINDTRREKKDGLILKKLDIIEKKINQITKDIKLIKKKELNEIIYNKKSKEKS
tara:strand:- start:300 stop:488 length:189 start_codon:yes stop_codon:yes gene_type:complete